MQIVQRRRARSFYLWYLPTHVRLKYEVRGFGFILAIQRTRVTKGHEGEGGLVEGVWDAMLMCS